MAATLEFHDREIPAHIGSYMMAGFAISILMLGGLAAWAATTEIAGAVVTHGSVIVESSVKKVQHPTGGVVAQLYVHEGDEVKANQLLVRLDDTVTKANLQVISKLLDELEMRAARLRAERDGASELEVPASLDDRLDDPNVKRIVDGEKQLFLSRRDSIAKQIGQLRERIAQFDKEVVGVNAQIGAKGQEIALIKKELDGLKTLESKQLVTTNRINSLRREAARLEGERGQLVASVAKAQGMVSEVELKILGTEQQVKTEVVDELRQVESKESEAEERRIAAQDQLKRIDIRAPQAGEVLQLAVHTVGGVVTPGEALMYIVPENDKLVVEARVSPRDIDQVHMKQPAVIRLAAFDQRTTPELNGTVTGVSGDLSKDPVTGEGYFLARIALPDTELAKLGEHKLVPGMPADVQIRTADRTALSYLVKPLRDQIEKAFRER
jgi:HlyD family secretion protein